VEGVVKAVPDMVRSFRKDPVMTALAVGGMVALGAVAPAGAAALSGAMLAYSAYRTRGDARKMGRFVGETAFWGGVGFAGARALKFARGTRRPPPSGFWAETSINASAPRETRLATARTLLAQRRAEAGAFTGRFANQTSSPLPEWKRSAPMPHRAAYDRILKVFQDPKKSYGLAQRLEMDVMNTAAAKGVSREAALEAVLSRCEKAGGFKPTINLENRSYSSSEFQGMLAKGSLFNDPYFSGIAHGAATHRVQWNLVMRDMKRNPGSYAEPGGSLPQPVDLYSTLGRRDFGSGFDGAPTRMWDSLFESFDYNFTRPEFVRGTAGHWKELGDWK
jgi:hypothetical protein